MPLCPHRCTPATSITLAFRSAPHAAQRMIAQALVLLTLVGLTVSTAWAGTPPESAPGKNAPATPVPTPAPTPKDLNLDDLSDLAEQVRSQFKLPGVAIAVADRAGVKAAGVAGVLASPGDGKDADEAAKVGEPSQPIRLDARWSIGSITKSLTATLAGIMVGEQTVEFDRALVDTFAREMTESIPAEAKTITLRQLLQHRSGLRPGTSPDGTFTALQRLRGELFTQRREMVGIILGTEAKSGLKNSPGTTFEYSNYGYAIAGAILEHAGNAPWEELVRTKIFEPLKLTSAGFDSPLRAGEEIAKFAPRGHRVNTADGSRLVEPEVGVENPRCVGPAGSVYMTITDLALYGSYHLRGMPGSGEAKPVITLMPADVFEVLHTDEIGQGYAMGWIIRDQQGEPMLWHNGSIGGWNYAVLMIWPQRDLVVAFCTNIGPETADPAAAFLAGEMLKSHPRPDAKEAAKDKPSAEASSDASSK